MEKSPIEQRARFIRNWLIKYDGNIADVAAACGAGRSTVYEALREGPWNPRLKTLEAIDRYIVKASGADFGRRGAAVRS